MNNPQLTPYKFPKELEVLYTNFFKSKHHDLKRQAISKVRSYLTKGPIPHSIEMTALLTEAIIEDEDKTGAQLFKYEILYPSISKVSEVSDLAIRMQYSVCIIKFVNGLLDPFQQSLYNISLHKLAIELNLPNYFVEARHASTHERLPTLEMMRLISQRALHWLRVQYWEGAIKQYKEAGVLDVSINEWKESIRNERKVRIKREDEEMRRNNDKYAITEEDIKSLETVLKSIKKIRREELQTNRKKSRELPSEITKLQQIVSSKSDEFIIRMLVYKNYLVLHGEKNENLNEKQLVGLRLMWGSITQELDTKFVFKLWKKLFQLSTRKCIVKYDQSYVEKKILNNQDIDYIQNECEYTQCVGWAKWILENVDIVNKNNINNVIDLFMTTSDISKKCMAIFQNKYSDLIKECKLTAKVSKMENIMNKFWIIDETFTTKDLQDIEPEIEDYVQNKRVKPSLYLFQTFPSWRPVPFGCPP